MGRLTQWWDLLDAKERRAAMFSGFAIVATAIFAYSSLVSRRL